MKILLNVLGLVLVAAICLLLSYNRKKIVWKGIAKMFVLEFLLAVFIIKVPVGQKAITVLSDGVMAMIDSGAAGLEFVFGDLYTGGSGAVKLSVFCVQALGSIIFVSAFVSALYYFGVLGFIIKWIGKAVSKVTATTEVESFVAVANMFLGQTDSPILVAKYLPSMTESEIFVVLVSGMGSMSASILGGYVAIGIPMESLLIASMLVPIGSIMISKLICPQTEVPKSIADVSVDRKGNNTNVIDAISEGCGVGMQMVIAISGALVGFIGIMTLLDKILGLVGVNFAQVFGYVFAPFSYLMGFDGENILMEGRLLGTKVILNEFIAFGDLVKQFATLDPRTSLVAAISLCGFANIGSMGICVGGIGVLCPEKKGVLAHLIVKAVIAGVLVSITSALLVSIVWLLF